MRIPNLKKEQHINSTLKCKILIIRIGIWFHIQIQIICISELQFIMT